LGGEDEAATLAHAEQVRATGAANEVTKAARTQAAPSARMSGSSSSRWEAGGRVE
jgi:hypothetical protein